MVEKIMKPSNRKIKKREELDTWITTTTTRKRKAAFTAFSIVTSILSSYLLLLLLLLPPFSNPNFLSPSIQFHPSLLPPPRFSISPPDATFSPTSVCDMVTF